jgi:hypothetical protein
VVGGGDTPNRPPTGLHGRSLDDRGDDGAGITLPHPVRINTNLPGDQLAEGRGAVGGGGVDSEPQRIAAADVEPSSDVLSVEGVIDRCSRAPRMTA